MMKKLTSTIKSRRNHVLELLYIEFGIIYSNNQEVLEQINHFLNIAYPEKFNRLREHMKENNISSDSFCLEVTELNEIFHDIWILRQVKSMLLLHDFNKKYSKWSKINREKHFFLYILDDDLNIAVKGGDVDEVYEIVTDSIEKLAVDINETNLEMGKIIQNYKEKQDYHGYLFDEEYEDLDIQMNINKTMIQDFRELKDYYFNKFLKN